MADVVLVAMIWSGAVGVLGALAVGLLGRRSLRVLLTACAMVSVAAVVAGVVGAAQAMFISSHDLVVALVVSMVAGAVGMTVAGFLGELVLRDVRAVRQAASAIGPDGLLMGESFPTPRTAELRAVRDDLVRGGERLAAAQRREHALEASRRELVAWVSHDLRTPLAGLRAMAEALEDDLVDDPARYHRQMRREVERLSRLVDDLFELARIQSGALTLALERLDLEDLVTDVLAGARPLATSRSVRLEAAVSSAVVDADGAGLGRVVGNLVINAIRHTPSDGTVEVRAGRVGDQAVLTVSDRCGGIPYHDLARVFDPGWRGSKARTPLVCPENAALAPGAGLGLAIARGIVEAHRGRIHVVNDEGGCRFEVRIPARAG